MPLALFLDLSKRRWISWIPRSHQSDRIIA